MVVLQRWDLVIALLSNLAHLHTQFHNIMDYRTQLGLTGINVTM